MASEKDHFLVPDNDAPNKVPHAMTKRPEPIQPHRYNTRQQKMPSKWQRSTSDQSMISSQQKAPRLPERPMFPSQVTSVVHTRYKSNGERRISQESRKMTMRSQVSSVNGGGSRKTSEHTS